MHAGAAPFLGCSYSRSAGAADGSLGDDDRRGGRSFDDAPAGAWVDRSRRKRLFAIIPGASAVLASVVTLPSHSLWPVALSRVATGIAGAVIGPGGERYYVGHAPSEGLHSAGSCQPSLNHAGNAVGLGFSDLPAWKLRLTAVFWSAVAFGIALAGRSGRTPNAYFDSLGLFRLSMTLGSARRAAGCGNGASGGVTGRAGDPAGRYSLRIR